MQFCCCLSYVGSIHRDSFLCLAAYVHKMLRNLISQKLLLSQVWLKLADKFKIIVEEVVHKQSDGITLRGTNLQCVFQTQSQLLFVTIWEE